MIIVIGFPKAGFSSIYKLFYDLGYVCAQQKERPGPDRGEFLGNLIYKAKKENKELLHYIKKSGIECLVELSVCNSFGENYWPQITLFKEIYQQNPNALYILNYRNPDNWLKSFKNWFDYDKKIFKYNSELFKDIKGDTNDKKLINLYNNHTKNVEDFFKNKPNAKFIKFDIENDDISKFSKYIDLKDIKKIPHINKSKISNPKYNKN